MKPRLIFVMGLHSALLAFPITALLALLTFFTIGPTAARAQTISQNYNSMTGLWSGNVECRKFTHSDPYTVRLDMQIYPQQILPDGTLYAPYITGRQYIVADGKAQFDRHILLEVRDMGGIVRVDFEGGRFNDDYANSLDAVSKTELKTRLSICGKRPSQITFKRYASPKQHAEIMGLWQGLMERCQRGDRALKVMFHPFDGRRIVADQIYEAIDGNYSGRNILVGEFDKASGKFVFSNIEARLRNNWDSSEMENYYWDIDVAKFDFGTSGQKSESLFAEIGSCPFGELKRVGSTEKTVSQSAPKTAKNTQVSVGKVSTDKELQGLWEGEINCGKKSYRDMVVKFSEPKAGRILAWASFYGQNPLAHDNTWLNFIGKKDNSGTGWRFAENTNNRMNSSLPQSMRNIEFIPGNTSNEIMVRFADGCPGTPTLKRITKSSPGEVPLIKADHPRGKFGALRRPDDRCQIILDWAANAENEFPGFGWKTTASEKVYPKMVPLFSDRVFIPVFGKAFDSMTDEERKVLEREIDELCMSDPIFKADFVSSYTLLHAIGESSENGGSFSANGIKWAVRQMRIVEHTAYDLPTGKITSEEEASERLKAIDAKRKSMEKVETFLWPGRIREITEELQGRQDALSAQLASVLLKQLDEPATAEGRLEAATKLERSVDSRFPALSSSVRDKIRRASLKVQGETANEVIGPILAALQTVPQDMSGFDIIGEVEKQFAPVKVMLDSSLSIPFVKMISDTRESLLTRLVEERIELLKSVPEGFEGVEKLALLETGFAGDFSKFSSTNQYKKGSSAHKQKIDELLSREAERQLVDLVGLPANAKGLLDAAQWKEKLDGSYAAFKSNAAYTNAVNQYTAVRRKQLIGAVEEFEQRISGKDKPAAQEVLKEYLSTPADWREPVAIEFQYVQSKLK